MGYILTVLIGLDDLGAAIIFNRNDLTISALSGIVMNAKTYPEWVETLAALKLSKWQYKFLDWIGPILNKIEDRHCQKAIASDLGRANTVNLLITKHIL